MCAYSDRTARVYTDTRYPTHKRQLVELLASAFHPRLGACSPLNMLPQDLLREICILANPNPGSFGPTETEALPNQTGTVIEYLQSCLLQ